MDSEEPEPVARGCSNASGEATHPACLLTAGNALTASRLVLLPVIIAGIALGAGMVAASAMALALITDLLDGRIARMLRQASEFGRTLDSTVDFVLIHALFIALYAAGYMWTYQFAAIYLAMLATLCLQFTTAARAEDGGILRSKFGKPTGALEYLFLLLLIVQLAFPEARYLGAAAQILFLILAVLVVLYVVECALQMRKLL